RISFGTTSFCFPTDRKLAMAHGYCRCLAPAACVRGRGGSQTKSTFRGAAASASHRPFIGISRDTDSFSGCACRRRNGAGEGTTAAAAPFASGFADANARLRVRMAESEGDGLGSKQNLV